MTVTRNGNTLTADLHGMQEADAKKALERLISSADKSITEIEVVHGHLSGQVLMNMVQKKLKHKRIERKILSRNRGMTSLLITVRRYLSKLCDIGLLIPSGTTKNTVYRKNERI